MKRKKPKPSPDPFIEIASQAIYAAEAVKVPFSFFVAGLREIEGEIRERRRQAEEELAAMDEEDPDLGEPA